MAPATRHHLCISFAVTSLIVFLVSLTLMLTPKSGRIDGYKNVGDVKRKNLVLGSRPPTCVNKCMSCKPCLATLVIPPHDHYNQQSSSSSSSSLSLYHGQVESYYLLTWKCQCGDKLFQP